MITAMLSGNLGNHIFNYAIVRAVAKKTGFQYSFDPVPKYDYLHGKEQMDFLDIDYGPFPNGITNIYNEKRVMVGTTNSQVYDPDVFNIPDNTELVGGCWQSESYYNKEDLKSWFKIRPEFESRYIEQLKSAGIVLDNNLCVINFRGGEYRGLSELIVRPEYYRDAMTAMRRINPDMKFIIITDDIQCASQFIPGVPCFHISIGCDYYILNKARFSILSNSSFAIMPTLLNENLKFVLAPKYWARHNVSNGYWGIGDQFYEGWNYVDREGKVETYEEVKEQAYIWRLENGL